MFNVVYFTVFGAGTGYILNLMGKPPQANEPEPQAGRAPCPRRRHNTAASINPGRTLGAPARRCDHGNVAGTASIWAFSSPSRFRLCRAGGFDLGIGILFPVFDPVVKAKSQNCDDRIAPDELEATAGGRSAQQHGDDGA